METQSNSVQDSWVAERHQLLSLAIYPRRILDGIWLKVIGFAFTLLWSAFGSLFRLLFSRCARVTNTVMALALVWCAVSLFL